MMVEVRKPEARFGGFYTENQSGRRQKQAYWNGVGELSKHPVGEKMKDGLDFLKKKEGPGKILTLKIVFGGAEGWLGTS